MSQAGAAVVDIYSSIIGQAVSSPTIFDLGINADEGGTLSVTGRQQ